MTRKYTSEACAWLADNYGGGDVHDTLDAFEERFGWRPTPQALYQKAFKLGLVKRPKADARGRLVERRIRWTCEPEMDAWMREHDRGHSIAAVQDAFEAEFGFRPAKVQISQWRARNGVGRKRNKGRSYNVVPVGTERDTGKGYILVKVAERSEVPMAKTNWRPRHHLVWESEHGEPVPDGCEIVHADRDYRNDSPDNLVAVDKALVGIINGNGLAYWDAESLSVAVARARLMRKAREVESGGRRECAVCGQMFEPTPEQAKYAKPVQTCPACLAAGKKSRGRRGDGECVRCAVCGREFARSQRNQRRCPECIRAAPKLSPSAHARRKQAKQRQERGNGR